MICGFLEKLILFFAAQYFFYTKTSCLFKLPFNYLLKTHVQSSKVFWETEVEFELHKFQFTFSLSTAHESALNLSEFGKNLAVIFLSLQMFITIFFVQKSLLDNFFPSSSLTASFHAISDIFPTTYGAFSMCFTKLSVNPPSTYAHVASQTKTHKTTRRWFFFLFSYHYGEEVTE